MTAERGEQRPTRINPDEFHPQIETNKEKIAAITPTFGAELVTLLTDKLSRGEIDLARLTLVTSENDPGKSQTLSVEIKKGEGSQTLDIELHGDWQEQVLGDAVLASFNGRIYRAKSPDDWQNGKPISEEGQILRPGEPFVLAQVGKTNTWPYSLDTKDYPKGARLLRFTDAFKPDGSLDVKKGETIICQVEKL